MFVKDDICIVLYVFFRWYCVWEIIGINVIYLLEEFKEI